MPDSVRPANGRLAWIIVTVLGTAFLAIFLGVSSYVVLQNDAQHADFRKAIQDAASVRADMRVNMAKITTQMEGMSRDIDDVQGDIAEVLRRIPPPKPE